MAKYKVISNIQIEHIVEGKNENEALDNHANFVELPKEYIENSWELESVEKI